MWKKIYKKLLKIRIYCNCGEDVERFMGKVFHEKIKFSTGKLIISLVNG